MAVRLLRNSNQGDTYVGLSTDTKTAAVDGALFLELDTDTTFIFDEPSAAWRSTTKFTVEQLRYDRKTQ